MTSFYLMMMMMLLLVVVEGHQGDDKRIYSGKGSSSVGSVTLIGALQSAA